MSYHTILFHATHITPVPGHATCSLHLILILPVHGQHTSAQLNHKHKHKHKHKQPKVYRIKAQSSTSRHIQAKKSIKRPSHPFIHTQPCKSKSNAHQIDASPLIQVYQYVSAQSIHQSIASHLSSTHLANKHRIPQQDSWDFHFSSSSDC